MVFERTDTPPLPSPPLPCPTPGLVRVFTHMALVLILDLYIPPFLVPWYQHAARFIGQSMRLDDRHARGGSFAGKLGYAASTHRTGQTADPIPAI
jgi:hypothetical protein